MNVQEFEGAQKKEPLTVVGFGAGAGGLLPRGQGRGGLPTGESKTHILFTPLVRVSAGSLRAGIVYGPWYRTRLGRLLL